MKEHRTLKWFRQRWVGKVVAYRRDLRGTVIGVGDDGAQCDYDGRRRAKPTGRLFVLREKDGRTVDEPFYNECVEVSEAFMDT